MKKLLTVLATVFLLLYASCVTARAQAYDDILKQSGAQELLDSLPQDTSNSLADIGVSSIDYSQLSSISFRDIINEITDIAVKEGKTPLSILASLIAVMLLYSILYSLKTSVKTTSMQQVLSVCVTLCVTCIIVIPVCSVIESGITIIGNASKFMLAYIPVMIVIMASSGQAVSSASYYSLMIIAGQGVGQMASGVIAPFLKIFLGLSVTAAVSPNVNLSGLVRFIGKITKWLLGFTMTVFTALLTFKHIIATGVDNVSTRAVRFTLTSLVPVVGSALSDAYRTVQSSVGLLKSGVGVFVIIAVGIMFLPAVLQCLFWMLTLGLGKSAGEILGLREPCVVLEAVNTVITTVFAILLCIMSVFIISTALVLMIGGGGS